MPASCRQYNYWISKQHWETNFNQSLSSRKSSKTNAKLLTQVQKRTTHKKRERESICNVNLCLCFNFINTKKKNTQSTACHRRRRRSGRLVFRIHLKGTHRNLWAFHLAPFYLFSSTHSPHFSHLCIPFL